MVYWRDELLVCVGDFCGPYGKCGDGLVCVQGYEEGLTEEQLRTYPSFCELAPTPTTGEPVVWGRLGGVGLYAVQTRAAAYAHAQLSG